MTNHPNRYRKHNIRGDQFINGFRDELAPRIWRIIIINGKAYNLDMYEAPCGQPLADMRVTLDEYGSLITKGMVPEFIPDDGEIDRIGKDVFAK